MSDNNTSLVPNVIKSASDAVQANLPETAKQTDSAISTVVGFFNNVVLYPVKKANLSYKYKLERFEDDLREKTASIPIENLQVPPVMIAGPTLEALRYAYDEKELREMYENLLASAMDNRKNSEAHPAFVDAIKQMSPLDAQVVLKIAGYDQMRCMSITFKIKNSSRVYSNGMPDYFVEELCDLADPFLISTSIINLSRLGFINIIDGTIRDADYDIIKSHPYVQSRINLFESFGKELDIIYEKQAIKMNNYGKHFAKVCLEKEV